MEITTQNRGWLQSEVQSRAVKIPRYLLAIVILFSSLYVAIISLRGLVLQTTEPIPLAALFLDADDLIGQPISTIDSQGFSCAYLDEPDFIPEVQCNLDSPSGTFSRVTIVSRGNVIYAVEFTAHENTLRVGHLLWLWGIPEIKKYGRRSVYLSWRKQSIYALVLGEIETYSLSRSVWRVCFFRRPM